ncbi:DUF4411 family protein [Ochrobactrum sp. GPK 3]
MTTYCADTSALVAAWVERYPPDFFPSLWDKFGLLIEQGRIFAPEEVRNELHKRSKDVADWLDQYDGFFRPTDELLLEEVTGILAKFPKLVMQQKVAFAADPFVIGLAKLEKVTVLTEEGAGSIGKPKIPFVCNDYGIECCSLLNLIKAEKWVMGHI